MHDNTQSRRQAEIKKAQDAAIKKAKEENPELTEEQLRLKCSKEVENDEQMRMRDGLAVRPIYGYGFPDGLRQQVQHQFGIHMDVHGGPLRAGTHPFIPPLIPNFQHMPFHQPVQQHPQFPQAGNNPQHLPFAMNFNNLGGYPVQGAPQWGNLHMPGMPQANMPFVNQAQYQQRWDGGQAQLNNQGLGFGQQVPPRNHQPPYVEGEPFMHRDRGNGRGLRNFGAFEPGPPGATGAALEARRQENNHTADAGGRHGAGRANRGGIEEQERRDRHGKARNQEENKEHARIPNRGERITRSRRRTNDLEPSENDGDNEYDGQGHERPRRQKSQVKNRRDEGEQRHGNGREAYRPRRQDFDDY